MRFDLILNRVLYLVILMVVSIVGYAQENNQVEMADSLRSSGKIYIVVAILCIIFLGIISYLVMLDRKVRKLEKEIKE